MSASFSLGWGGRRHRLPPCITQRKCVNRLGTWNIKGINGIAKREEEEEEDVFRRGKFELLALTQTKMKGDGEVSWCEMKWYHSWCSRKVVAVM